MPQRTVSESNTAGRRPSHLVLFRDVAAANTAQLASILKVGTARGARARASCAHLNEKHGVTPKVFERMGVAVASLSEDEIGKLEQSDAVETVVRNEVRSLPPIIQEHEGVQQTEITVSVLLTPSSRRACAG